MVGDCPKEVRRAIRALARAVKAVADLADLPSPDSLTEYHAKEYLEEMETLLVHQLLTALAFEDERNAVLLEYDLDYLTDKLLYLEREWTEY